MKKILIYAAVVALMTACSNQPQTTEATQTKEAMKQELNLTQEWDKVFPLSEKVNHRRQLGYVGGVFHQEYEVR